MANPIKALKESVDGLKQSLEDVKQSVDGLKTPAQELKQEIDATLEQAKQRTDDIRAETRRMKTDLKETKELLNEAGRSFQAAAQVSGAERRNRKAGEGGGRSRLLRLLRRKRNQD